MQKSLYRFRIAKTPSSVSDSRAARPTARTPPVTESSLDITAEFEGAGIEHDNARQSARAACERCRRMKRKCSKTYPSCSVCLRGAHRCSFSARKETPQESVERLEAKIELLTKHSVEPRAATTVSVSTHEGQNNAPKPQAIVQESFTNQISVHDTPMTNSIIQDQILPTSFSDNAISTDSRHDNLNHSLERGRLNLGDQALQFSTQSPERVSTEQFQTSNEFQQGLDTVTFAKAYFRHVHRSYPFMNQRDTMSMITLIAKGSSGNLTQRQLTKLRIVMAIGCTTLHRVGHVPSDVVKEFGISPAHVLQQCLPRSDVDALETLLLLGLYSLFEPSGCWPWKIVGMLTRQVSILGLSRQSSAFKELTIQEKEMRSRLFWSAWNFDRLVSVTMGLPFGIQDHNVNIPLPSITLQEYSAPESSLFSLNIQINRHVIELRRLEEEIMERLHLIGWREAMSRSRSEIRTAIQDLESKVQNWYTHGCLLTTQERDHVAFHNTIAWLNMRHQNLLLLLYSPSHVNSAISETQFHQLRNCALQCVEFNAVLFRNRHLPLNWVTLCRFVTMAAILSYCFIRHPTWTIAESVQVQKLANILDSFPESWEHVDRAARILQSLASCLSNSPEGYSPETTHRAHTLSLTSAAVMPTYTIIQDIAHLVRDVLGESSIYNKSIEAARDLLGDDQPVSCGQSRPPATYSVLADPSISTSSPISWNDSWEFTMDAV